MSFLTTILRKSGDYWVVLCLENGVVSQGSTKEEALIKMREAAWH
jgi:predicted RNase H-like HicB family nuclease